MYINVNKREVNLTFDSHGTDNLLHMILQLHSHSPPTSDIADLQNVTTSKSSGNAQGHMGIYGDSLLVYCAKHTHIYIHTKPSSVTCVL